MIVRRFADFEELQPYKQQWNRLAGESLFQSWEWLSTWWKHYGCDARLRVLLFFATTDSNSNSKPTSGLAGSPEELLVGVLPSYIGSNVLTGKTIRLLGDGEVCSDHLDILALEEDKAQVAVAAASHLLEHAEEWDLVDFPVTARDANGLMRLSDELDALGCQVSRTPNVGRWAIPLPDDWEAFLGMQSKSHRKKLRRLERSLERGRQFHWHLVRSQDQFESVWGVFTKLHQKRRISLGEPGCFSSKPWAAFHHDISRQLLDQGRLRLSWMELDGQAVAAEYQFATKEATYAYQSGLDPDALHEQPGRLALIQTIRNAIGEGHKTFDLLRGDERYKTQWQAVSVATDDIRIVSPRVFPVLRNRAYLSLRSAVRFARKAAGSRK